jgi:aspartyl protease family protein
MNRLLVSVAVVLGGAFILASFFAFPDAPKPSAKPTVVEGPGAPRQPVEEQGLVLRRNAGGQFHLTAQVNGEDVDFLVDTGADVVALTVDTAELLGLDVSREGFAPIGRTASGVTDVKRIRLERVEIDGRQFRNVDAAIVQDLSSNLLGQSLLRRLGGVELRGDRMTIHLAP